MVRRQASWAVAVLFVAGCINPDKSTANFTPGTAIRSVAQTRAMATGVWVNVSTANADSVRVVYVSADRTDTGSTPWFSASVSQLPVLGLKSSTTYQLTPQVLGANTLVTGNSSSYQTNALPVALQSEAFHFLTGQAFSGGLNLVAVQQHLTDCFAILVDSVGVIRWYRDIGVNPCYETKQQPNGHFTVFTGLATPPGGAYVELTPEGDSVRTIVARGSA